MSNNVIDQLVGVTQEELALLRKVNEVGAMSEDELAIKLKRGGDDLAPEIDSLVNRHLLQVRTVKHDDEETRLYLTAREVRDVL
jgi:hypothetical protein